MAILNDAAQAVERVSYNPYGLAQHHPGGDAAGTRAVDVDDLSGQSHAEQILALADMGPGGRGIIYGGRGPGQAGHVFNGVNQKGTIRFLDGQSSGTANFDDGFVAIWFLTTGRR